MSISNNIFLSPTFTKTWIILAIEEYNALLAKQIFKKFYSESQCVIGDGLIFPCLLLYVIL